MKYAECQVLPIKCVAKPATIICNNTNKYYETNVIVLSVHKYFSFNILLHCVKWDIIRIIWIGFYKNDNNDKCLLNLLPKDVIKHIVKFVGITKRNTENTAQLPL